MMSRGIYWFFIYLIIGLVIYIWDRRWGQKPYRWWYNWSHEFPLADDVKRGFIAGHRMQRRFFVAVFVSLLTILTVAYFSATDVLLENFVIWLIGIPALMIGFVLGPRVSLMWEKKGEVFEALEKVERGETSIMPEVKGKFAYWSGKVAGIFSSFRTPSAPATTPPATTSVVPAPQPAPEPEVREDPRATIDRYGRR